MRRLTWSEKDFAFQGFPPAADVVAFDLFRLIVSPFRHMRPDRHDYLHVRTLIFKRPGP